jgi:photosystem II stability/assembly factor-like uncharacterized protein
MTRAQLVVAVLMAGAGAAHAGVVVDATPAFRPGPYTCLTVDPADPERVVVGTADGHVLWTGAGGGMATEALVLSGREYTSAPLRGLPKLSLIGDLVGQRESDRSLYSGANVEPPGTRLFLYRLKEGLPVQRWQYWMAIDNPVTEINDVSVFGARRPSLVATESGVFGSDARQLAWTRVFGVPRPKQQDSAAFAVTVDPADPAHALAGTSQGLLVSTDGGRTFHPHSDDALAGEDFRRFVWDRDDAQHLLAVTDDAIFQSKDSGATFELGFSTTDRVNAVAIAREGAYVATSKGLLVPGEDDAQTRLYRDQNVVGVVPLGARWFLVATDESVFIHNADGQRRLLMQTGHDDPILRLEGTATVAWVLTRYGIRRIASEPVARAPRATVPPRVLVSGTELEAAVLEHIRIGDPTKTRIHKRWYAALIPKITVYAQSAVSQSFATVYDATLAFPVRVRRAQNGFYCCGNAPGGQPAEFLTMVTWDLAGLFPTASNPWGLIEMNLRAMRDQILSEVRWRYREARALTALLARPAVEPDVYLQWRMRLEEHAAYLEVLSGRRVIDLGTEEEGEP